ncbi:MAG TPA: cupin domain-containing protein [Allocoleopsis sp.]
MELNDACFCELAPLYALDLLDEQERRVVEEQIAECPDLANELAEFQAAVAAIPYSTPSVPMAADLQERLFQRIGQEMPSDEPVIEAPSPPTVPFELVMRSPFGWCLRQSQNIVWQPHPVPGVTIATLHVDPVKREITGLLRAEPGVRYPLHRHAAIEEMFMLEGDLAIAGEVYGAGDYIRSDPGSSHAPETNGGCMFFFRTSLDDEYPDSTAG